MKCFFKVLFAPIMGLVLVLSMVACVLTIFPVVGILNLSGCFDISLEKVMRYVDDLPEWYKKL